MTEFRRQQSRVWWSSFHADDVLGSPIPRPGPSAPRAPRTPCSPLPDVPQLPAEAGPQSPSASASSSSPGSLEQGRDSSSSPSTSHKSQDSGFSDSEGPNRLNASPLSSSPEVTDAVQLTSTPSPAHSRLQLCLSGACLSTPQGHLEREGPASFGGHATPGELRKKLSQDDSCIISRLGPALGPPGPAFRRQQSAEEPHAHASRRTHRAVLSRSMVLDVPDDDSTTPLNQTFPMPGHLPDSGHRALRSFIKNKSSKSHSPSRACSRRAAHRHSRDSRDSRVSVVEDSVASDVHATVVERRESKSESRTLPEGEETAPSAVEFAGGRLAEADLLAEDDGEPLYLDLTSTGPGLPAHTSTPKATPASLCDRTPATQPTVIRRPPGPIPSTPLTHTPSRRAAGVAARRLHDKKSARPVNLFNTFSHCPGVGAGAVEGAVEGDPETRLPQLPKWGPVSAWLGQLQLSCEPECSVALQSKALLGADPRGHLQLQKLNLSAPNGQGLSQLQARAQRLSVEYTRLCSRVQKGVLDQVAPLTQLLVQHVRDFLKDYEAGAGGGAGAGGDDGVPVERADRLRAACDRLLRDAGRPQQQQQHQPQPADLAASLAALRSALTAAVDAILERHVQELVSVLEGPASPLALRGAMSGLCALGRQGAALADLVVRCGGVRALLQVVLDARTVPTRRAALRALAAVCCTARAIRSLEQAGGVEVVAELLAETNRSEEELAEAAAVLAQITAPWVPDNTRVEGLSKHLDPVVHALTRLVKSASSGEVLLLGTAALAHLSYVESSAVWPLLSARSAGVVLQAVRAQGPRCSVFLQEQAATLLANMSAVPEARAELAEDRAVVALLCFLQLRPSPLQRSADIAAAERVQHKAAIALSRLASDPEVAKQVVSLEGVPRLVRLCREERERNHSDGVLVACLAALRKIAANCGSIVLHEKDHSELLEPRLLDSFMLFSTKQESYV